MAVPSTDARIDVRFPIDAFRLDNGLQVIVQTDPSAPLAAVYTSYQAGSARDPEARSGLAHLCEHLSFAGGDGDPTIEALSGHLSQIIEDAGGVTDARTSHDRTVFGCLVPSDRLDLALWTESRRMAAPACGLSREVLSREQLIIGQEQRQMLEDQPYGRALSQLHELLYPAGHPYRRLPIGTPEGIRDASLDDVARFFDCHYRPENAVLAVVGDVSAAATRELISRYFGRLGSLGHLGSPGRSAPPPVDGLDPQVLDATSPVVGQRRSRQRVPFARTYIAWRAPSYGSGQHLLPGLLAKCWAGRDCSLQRRLVADWKVAQSVEAVLVSMRHALTLVFFATAQRGVEAPRLQQALVEALEAEIAAGVEGQALRRAQKKALTDHYVNMRYLQKRADFLAQHLGYLGDVNALEGEEQQLLAPDVGALDDFVRRTCRADRRGLLTVIPQGETW